MAGWSVPVGRRGLGQRHKRPQAPPQPALFCGPGSENVKRLRHKVSSPQEKDMPIAALERSQRVYRPIFFLDPSCDCIILQDSFNPEIVADRAAVRPPHGLYFLSRSPHIGVSIIPKLTKSRQIISGTVYSNDILRYQVEQKRPASANLSDREQGTAEAGRKSLRLL